MSSTRRDGRYASCLVILVMVLPKLSFANAKYDIKDHCDIPRGTIKSMATKSVDECTNLCSKEPKCEAVTFISGWNRCVLKTEPSPQHTVTFFSGVVREGAVGISAPNISILKSTNLKDHDLPGSDLKQVGQIKSAEGCRSSCQWDKACIAFTYIGGYATCWHKGAKLKMVKKIFTCGIKAQE